MILFQWCICFISIHTMTAANASPSIPDLRTMREATDEAIEEVRIMHVEEAAVSIANRLDVEISGQVAEEIADRIHQLNTQ